MPENQVSVKVGGKELSTSSKTTAAEIRKAAKLEPGSVLAVQRDGHYVVINGQIELTEGDKVIASRPFTREFSQKFKVLSSKKQRKSDHMIRIIFPSTAYLSMQEAFAGDESSTRESYALAICGLKTDHASKSYSYMVRSLHIPAPDELVERSSISVTPKAEFLERVLSEAQKKGTAVLDLHTHIRSPSPSFSWVDLSSGIDSGRFLKNLGLKFLMCVAGTQGFSLVEYDAEHDAMALPEKARFDMLTLSGKKSALKHKASDLSNDNIKVGIVGIESLGPAVIERLAAAGITDIILCKDVNDIKDNDALKHCDVIISTSDEKRIKSALNDISLKYYVPLIKIAESPPGEVTPPVAVIPTHTGCLECQSSIDKNVPVMPDLITCCTGIEHSHCNVKSIAEGCPKCGVEGILGLGDPQRRGRGRTS